MQFISNKILTVIVLIMNLEFIGVLATVIGLFGTVFGFVIKLSLNLGKYMQQQEALRDELKESNAKAREKFNDYYAFKLDVSSQLASIAEKLESIQEDMKEIKNDIRGK